METPLTTSLGRRTSHAAAVGGRTASQGQRSKRSHQRQEWPSEGEAAQPAGMKGQGRKRRSTVDKEVEEEALTKEQYVRQQKPEQHQRSRGGMCRQDQLLLSPPQQQEQQQQREQQQLGGEQQEQQQPGGDQQEQQQQQQAARPTAASPDAAPAAAPAAHAPSEAEAAAAEGAIAGAEPTAEGRASEAPAASDGDGWEDKVQLAAAALVAGEAIAAGAAAEGAGEHEVKREDDGQQPSRSSSPAVLAVSPAAAAAAAFAGDVDRLAFSRAGQSHDCGHNGSRARPSSPAGLLPPQTAAGQGSPPAVDAALPLPAVLAAWHSGQQCQGRPPRPTRTRRTPTLVRGKATQLHAVGMAAFRANL